MAHKSIQQFLANLHSAGGVAFSNTYEVTFSFTSGANTTGNSDLKNKLKDAGFGVLNANQPGAYSNLVMMCEEASLPGLLANTGQTTGVFMGEGQVNYAHTQSYQDLTLGWICDANLAPLKFLNTWMKFIFPDIEGQSNPKQSANRVAYPDQYKCDYIQILKGERNSSSTVGRSAGLYKLYDAWPYSIQSTPLAYGSSQLLKVTAAFYYRRWEFEGKSINN
jgi:hypothetical protein